MRNGGTYEGDWLNANRDGSGKYIWPDGSFYDGLWKDDKANGSGKLGIN